MSVLRGWRFRLRSLLSPSARQPSKAPVSLVHRYKSRFLTAPLADMAPPKTPNASRGTIRGSVSQNLMTFTVRASPLPQSILGFTLENLAVLKQLQRDRRLGERSDLPDFDEGEGVDVHGDIIRKPNVKPDEFWRALQGKCTEEGGEWEDIVDKIWAFGPQGAGGCVLIDSRTSTAGHNS